MIQLNGKQFAPHNMPLPAAAVGTFRAFAKSIKLFNRAGRHIGTINGHGCLLCATELNGRTWYNFATIAEIGRYESYMQSVDEPAAALRTYCGTRKAA